MNPPLLDTNILIYAFSDDQKAGRAQECLAQPFVLSTQALNEFANVALRKLGMTAPEVRIAIADICLLAEDIFPLDRRTHEMALDIAERYRLSFYDSLMLSAACLAGCPSCLSEDMQHGLLIEGGTTVANPFI
ncbi:PIN domain-containing protein [Rhizobium daejeonense]|uniref:PIN domain-containing protein n=1 Tax=Rhizobium daejeonense TaxID=240521 RepID=A0A6M1RQN8_9HYPH|nr:PIN domain-containing protein [Rhizobium daejeonense]NGO63642.1 PIN domain-containing protein [Rhizobium daejeonense]